MKIVLLAVLSTAALAAADAQAPARYKTGAELTAALAAGRATPDMLTSAVDITDRHRINLIRRTKAAGAVAHEGFAELHHVIEGTGTLVTGGTIARPEGRGAATIQNGVSRRVGPGDVILIPPGVPHWYKDLDGTITYLEVRWEEKP